MEPDAKDVQQAEQQLRGALGEELCFPDRKPWDPSRCRGFRRALQILLPLVILSLVAAAVCLRLIGSRGETAEMTLSALSAQNASLLPGSRWSGTMTIRGCRGKGALQNGTTEITGEIDRDAEDRIYLQLYDRADTQRIPLLSAYVNLSGNSVDTVIGEKDAWLLDLWLTEKSAESLCFVLENNALRCSDYRYDAGQQSCYLDFALSREPNTP